ncbi:MAG: redox-regulated ATPase YchF [Candidatus Promineifilaceae bacterium]|nr:redox-regulated ATPase YchF [Candidatus Promineifilaceae bacterium]
MSLNIGIIGLPNVGKSTVFNALTRAQIAQVANYPFCTIEPNKAVVPVPDARVERLAELVEAPQAIEATIEFVDIAGLVKGASRGEGLGNQFLAHIREADALVHVVRCFQDPNVVHVGGEPHPEDDVAIIETELLLADLEQLARKIERLERQVRGDRERYGPLLETAEALVAHLEQGARVATFAGRDSDAFRELNADMRFLTAKPVIFAANVDEASLDEGSPAEEDPCVAEVRALAAEREAEVVVLSARLEEEMAALSETEREEFMALVGASESGLEQVIRKSYETLGLISYFSYNENEVRAWTIEKGWTAPRAAGVIHTDFERGFIRAEVIPFKTFDAYGSTAAARAAGKLRSEGRDYVVQDGDVIYFRFNV